MKGDFSRLTFRPENHYRSVRVQQGRVQLDADWNEQADIEAHRDETTAQDLIGHEGAPWTGGGFQVGMMVVPRTLRAVDFVAGLGLAVGDDATVLGTTDGVAWTLQQVPGGVSGSLRGVCLSKLASASAATGFVVGDRGTILKSLNSGQSWTLQSAPTGITASLRAVHSIDGQRALAVGDNGTILLTVNGQDWTSQPAPAGVAVTLRVVQLVQGPTSIHAFIVGDNATILTSTDGGQTWTRQQAPAGITAHLRGAHFPSDQIGYAVGDGATILATTNGGATWTSQTVPATVTANLRGVHFNDPTSDPTHQQGIAVGDAGTVLQTTNGGGTWPPVTSPPTTVNLRAVHYASGRAHAVGDDSVIVANLDGSWASQPAPTEWGLSAGHLYVDGILCENERNISLNFQPDAEGITPGGGLVYLDVWERHLTAVERPELREVALGGPDTTTRTRTVWQVKTAPGDCASFQAGWAPPDRPASTGRLAARSAPVPPITDVCLVPPAGGFRRLENQLYRIEIHSPRLTPGKGTFKWSRDNGSTVARVELVQGSMIKVSNPGNSPLALSGFAGATFVEVVDEPTLLKGDPGIIVPVNPAQDSSLPIADGTTLTPGPEAVVRRWESAPIPLVPGTWIDLGTGTGNDKEGIQIRFEEGVYQTGDYWLIPARTLTGSIEWPSADAEALSQPRQGIEHHYAPLATVLPRPIGPGFVIKDCRRLFPSLPDLTTLFYVGGDGQECLPGDQLPRPLQVACSVPGTVRFTAGAGTVAAATPVPPSAGTVVTLGPDKADQNGVYTCYWKPDPSVADRSQQVEAVLLDDSDPTNPTAKPLRFSANLSLASQVQYDPSSCAALTGQNTVQKAIDALMQLATIHYVSGTGQESRKNMPLPQPLQVGLSSTCGPSNGRVLFTTTAAHGQLAAPGTVLTSSTNAPPQFTADAMNGIAGCVWMLDPAGAVGQTVTATLLDGQNPVGLPIVFTASLSLAAEVSYDPSMCANLAGKTTVQDAIDQLCQVQARKPGVHITKVALGTPTGVPFANDAFPIRPGDLTEGILVTCDGPIDPLSVNPKPGDPQPVTGKPVFSVTLEVPFPLTPADRAFWNVPTIGYQPIVVDAQVNLIGDSLILWRPTIQAVQWMNAMLDAARSIGKRERVLAHVLLKGNFIWSSKDPDLNLDGTAFAPRGNLGLQLPTTESARGGPFEMWFWLALATSTAGVTVTASPSSIPANGSTSTITVTVRSPSGAPVPGDPLRLTLSGGGSCGSLNSTTATTNAAGQATVVYTSSITAGSCTITATEANTGLTASATITQT